MNEITNTDNYSTFQVVVENVLEAHAPCKKKVIRGNSKPHMTKQLRKEIMKRSRLKYIANKSKRPEDFAAYKRQRNLIAKLNKQQKKLFFNQIDVEDNKKSLWKICSPYFSNKSTSNEKILLVEEDTVISDDKCIANIFNSYFCNITKGLGIKNCECPTKVDTNDPVNICYTRAGMHLLLLYALTINNCISIWV